MPLSPEERELVLEYIRTHRYIRSRRLARHFGVSSHALGKWFVKLAEQGVLVRDYQSNRQIIYINPNAVRKPR